MGELVKYHGDVIINDKNGKALRAITRGQQELLEVIDNNDIIFVNGPAGTGKTVVATWAGIAGIDDGLYEHLVLTRPIVEAQEELGFLPGSIDDKVGPFMQPLFEAIEVVKGKRITPEMAAQFDASKSPQMSGYRNKKIKNGEMPAPKLRPKTSSNEEFYKKVSVCPLAYLRGSTKAKSFIVVDEAQNILKGQMKLMLTRLGHGSKMIICGDISQSDLDRKSDSGFRHAQHILGGVKGIGFVTFGIDDIVRHRLIKDIIIRYEKSENAFDGHGGKGKAPVYDNREFLDNDYDYDDDGDDEDDVDDKLDVEEYPADETTDGK